MKKTYRVSYKDAIEFINPSIVLCNNAINLLNEDEMASVCEQTYNEDTDDYNEIFQTYITSLTPSDVEDIRELFPSMIVVYCETLDCYLLCVDHWGTSWDYVGIDMNIEENREHLHIWADAQQKEFNKRYE